MTFTKVGNDLIDHDHDEFVHFLQKLASASNTEFPALFQALYQHSEQHFERELELMQRSGFPAEAEHSGEHQRLLGEFRQFTTRVDKGLVSFARAFVNERLPGWFLLHVATMDSALAAHLNSSKANS